MPAFQLAGPDSGIAPSVGGHRPAGVCSSPPKIAVDFVSHSQVDFPAFVVASAVVAAVVGIGRCRP